MSASQYVLWINPCRIMDCFWKETTSKKRKFKGKKTSNKTSVRPESRSQCCVAERVQVGMKGTFLTWGGLWDMEQTGLHLDWRQEARELSTGVAATQEVLPEKREFTSIVWTGAERGENLNCSLEFRLISIVIHSVRRRAEAVTGGQGSLHWINTGEGRTKRYCLVILLMMLLWLKEFGLHT